MSDTNKLRDLASSLEGVNYDVDVSMLIEALYLAAETIDYLRAEIRDLEDRIYSLEDR